MPVIEPDAAIGIDPSGFADAEVVYSYEGTHEINSLIVGRAMTGSSAFV